MRYEECEGATAHYLIFANPDTGEVAVRVIGEATAEEAARAGLVALIAAARARKREEA